MPHLRPGRIALSVKDSAGFTVQLKPRHEENASLKASSWRLGTTSH